MIETVTHQYLRCRTCGGQVRIDTDIGTPAAPIRRAQQVDVWHCRACHTSMARRTVDGRVVVEPELPMVLR